MELRGGGSRWFALICADLRWVPESATCKKPLVLQWFLHLEPSKIGSDPDLTPKRPQNDPKCPKVPQSDPKMTKSEPKVTRKCPPKCPQSDPKVTHMQPKCECNCSCKCTCDLEFNCKCNTNIAVRFASDRKQWSCYLIRATDGMSIDR